MMPALLRHGLIAGLAVISVGCIVPPLASGGDLLAETISLSQCPTRPLEPGLVVFDQQAWSAHLRSAGEQNAALGQWQANFDKQTIVLVQMGEKPSLGYSIKLESPVLRSAEGVVLTVRQQTPAPGMLAGMALTSPCTYALLNAVDVSTVVVRDAGSQQTLHTWQR